MSIVSTQTEPRVKEVLAQCLSLFGALTHLEMTAEDAFEVRKAQSILYFIIGDYEPNEFVVDDAVIVNPADLHLLIRWPDAQVFMKYEWFREECHLHHTFDANKHPSLAYFVPVSRINEINQPG